MRALFIHLKRASFWIMLTTANLNQHRMQQRHDDSDEILVWMYFYFRIMKVAILLT